MPPAIFSHQGFVLPLKMRSPERFDGTALCVGAAIPDIMILVTKLLNNEYYHYINHSLLAFIWLVPLTVIFTILLSRYIMPWISKILPKLGFLEKIGIFFGLDDWYLLKNKKFTTKWLVIAIYSAIIGIASHLMMDLLGHYVNPIYMPFQPFSYLPAWFSESTWVLFGQTRTNSDAVFLIMTIIFGYFSLVWLRIIKKENLLKIWYGVMPNSSQTINIYTASDDNKNIIALPFDPDRWVLKENVAIKNRPFKLWIKPSIENILFVLVVLVLGDIVIELLLEVLLPQFFQGQAPLWMRLFSISHITAYLIVLILLFDEKFIRSFFIVFIPLLFVLVYVVFMVLLPDPTIEKAIVEGILISHSPHFIMTIILIISKKWTDWQYILHARIVYFLYFIILYYYIDYFYSRKVPQARKANSKSTVKGANNSKSGTSF